VVWDQLDSDFTFILQHTMVVNFNLMSYNEKKIIGSNAIQGMDVCPFFLCFHILLEIDTP
jgi:hypothetical protein